jgi:hypothetical protein
MISILNNAKLARKVPFLTHKQVIVNIVLKVVLHALKTPHLEIYLALRVIQDICSILTEICVVKNAPHGTLTSGRLSLVEDVRHTKLTIIIQSNVSHVHSGA